MFKMDFLKDAIEIEFVGNLALTPNQTLTFHSSHSWKIKINKMSKIRYDDACVFITEPNSPVTIMAQFASDILEKDWIHLVPTMEN